MEESGDQSEVADTAIKEKLETQNEITIVGQAGT